MVKKPILLVSPIPQLGDEKDWERVVFCERD